MKWRAVCNRAEKSYVRTQGLLTHEATSLPEIDRINLLATIKTGEPLDEHLRLLRWELLRNIVIRAYQLTYRKCYNPVVWHSFDKGCYTYYNSMINSAYEMEIERVINLFYYIKHYGKTKYHKWHSSPPIKKIWGVRHPVEGELYPEQQVILAALKGFYRNFLGFEFTLSMSRKGVAYRPTFSYKTNQLPRKATAHPPHQLIQDWLSLKENKWDVITCLELWIAQQENEPTRLQVLRRYHELDKASVGLRIAYEMEYYDRFIVDSGDEDEESNLELKDLLHVLRDKREELSNVKRLRELVHSIERSRNYRNDIQRLWGKAEQD